MKSGDTFLIEEPGTSLDSHLWIVISDPAADPDKVLLVNLTSHRPDKDQACVLSKGDHPFIKHKTCVEYRRAKLVSVVPMEHLLDSGRIRHHTPVTPKLLSKILSGVPNSRMKNEHVTILTDQGLVDPENCGL